MNWRPASSASLPATTPTTGAAWAAWSVPYGGFFAGLADSLALAGLPVSAEDLLPFLAGAPAPPRAEWLAWREAWCAWRRAQAAPFGDPGAIATALARWNLPATPVRRVIERIWAAIDERDDWQPLQEWLASIRL